VETEAGKAGMAEAEEVGKKRKEKVEKQKG